MALLERVVSDLSLAATAAGCSVVLAPHAPIEGWWDEFRIEQVVVNLLTNALRYGGGGTVEVSVHEEGCNARIDVRDHGKGIAPDFIDRIFEPYERGAKSGEPKGLGLGLYISRQLATSHGGHLTVQSTPGQGATFSLTLPCTEVAVPAVASA
jgi:signal transduction histidine kinase